MSGFNHCQLQHCTAGSTDAGSCALLPRHEAQPRVAARRDPYSCSGLHTGWERCGGGTCSMAARMTGSGAGSRLGGGSSGAAPSSPRSTVVKQMLNSCGRCGTRIGQCTTLYSAPLLPSSILTPDQSKQRPAVWKLTVSVPGLKSTILCATQPMQRSCQSHRAASTGCKQQALGLRRC